MIDLVTITPEFPQWYRILGGNRRKNVELKFEPGINVIASPNGSGKSTIMDAIKYRIIPDAKHPELRRSESGEIDGLEVKTVDLTGKKIKPVYFVGIDDLAPDRQKLKISPFDMDGAHKIAYWMDKGYLSHGQSNFESIEDLMKIAAKGSLVWLDEPELALDMSKMIELIELLKEASKKTQVIVISHHPFFVLNKDMNVIELDGTKTYQNASRKALKAINMGL